ncbi:hypothetical protein HAX54_050260 [Datura stramonium]|uniref:Uncharacterized protein n=1 Tax=Datura stramonium TaxID=4076 RepID=A0ABS8SWZ2_DATST|nr:hypothetical protein [Datura stramonium]
MSEINDEVDYARRVVPPRVNATYLNTLDRSYNGCTSYLRIQFVHGKSLRIVFSKVVPAYQEGEGSQDLLSDSSLGSNYLKLEKGLSNIYTLGTQS